MLPFQNLSKMYDLSTVIENAMVPMIHDLTVLVNNQNQTVINKNAISKSQSL